MASAAPPDGASHAERIAYFREEEIRRRAAMKLSTKLLAPGTTESTMLDCAVKLQGHNYDDVVEERASEKLCGYPPCTGPTLQSQGAGKVGIKGGKKFMLDTQHHLVLNAEKLGMFCSQRCWKASDKYRMQIPAQYRRLVVLDAAEHPVVKSSPKDQVVVLMTDNETEKVNEVLTEPTLPNILEHDTKTTTVETISSATDTQNSEPWVVVEKSMRDLTLHPKYKHFPKAGDVKHAERVDGYQPKLDHKRKRQVETNNLDVNDADDDELTGELDESFSVDDEASSYMDSESEFGNTFMDLSSVKEDIEREALSLSVFQITWETLSEWVTPNTRSVVRGNYSNAVPGSVLEQHLVQVEDRGESKETSSAKDESVLQTGQVERSRAHVVTQSLLVHCNRVLDVVNDSLQSDNRSGIERGPAIQIVRDIILTMDFVRTIPSLVNVHWKSLAVAILYSLGNIHPSYCGVGLQSAIEKAIENDTWKIKMSVHQVQLLAACIRDPPAMEQ